jgi:hypothetical protein
MMLSQILIELAQVDTWLDDAVSDQYKHEPLAQDWARIAKVSEELGEAVNAFILFTGQNPRKQGSNSIQDTLEELADVAITAMLAIQHFTKDEAQTGVVILDKVRLITRRMVNNKIATRRESAYMMQVERAESHSFTGMTGPML